MIIFMNTQRIVGSPEGNYLFKNVSYLSHFTTQTVVFYVYQKTMLNNRETNRKKSSQYKVTTPQMAFTYNLNNF